MEDFVQDELGLKIDYYAYLLKNSIDLRDFGSCSKAKKLKGKSKVAKAVVVVNRPLVEPIREPIRLEEKFYITTAISYTNGNPHVGHAYEAVTSDVIARYHRVYGRRIFFLTGTDEHGQKVEQAAQALGMSPIDVATMYAEGFKKLNERLNVSYDYFIRTTQPHHESFVQKLWLRVRENGDIYLKPYVGWYNVHEEQYVTDIEAEMSGFKDQYGRPYERKEEESYFFRMSKYQSQLVAYIEENPDFIQPNSRRAEILSFLKEPLHDLCVSRTVCQWGVKCPLDPEYQGDKTHVMYVWFDALSNYLSGIGYWKGKDDDIQDNSEFWPAVHIIGKDIIRFHCVYWPTMLLAAGIPLPRSVFGHGFVVAKDGRKMSKSLGNTVDVQELINCYPADAIRFYLARESVYGADLPFNDETLCSIHNAVLVSGVGNLVHRSTSLCASYCEGKVPVERAFAIEGSFPFSLENDLVKPFEIAFSVAGGFQMHQAAEALTGAVNATNKFLQDLQPWAIKDTSRLSEKRAIVRTCLEALYIIAHFLSPFAPEGAGKIFDKLGVQPTYISALSGDFNNLPEGTLTYVGEVLYTQIEVKTETGIADFAEKIVHDTGHMRSSKTDSTGELDADAFEKIDIKVGRIIKAWPHETADGLFCELIDLGEDKPREIASGLRAFYSLEDMQNRLVLVVCNLKPAKLKGFTSHGMVLCASNEVHDKVEFVEPPVESKVGERVFLDGKDPTRLPEPALPSVVTRKKLFQQAAADLRTNENGEATWKGLKIRTNLGVCRAKTLLNAKLS